MNRRLLSLGLSVMLALVLSVGGATAQDPDPGEELEPEVVQPQEVQPTELPPQQGQPVEDRSAVAGTVASRINYQGVLEEDGSPVTGDRDMVFRLYSNSSCTTLEETINAAAVTVEDGLFSVPLDVTHANFDGRELWLRVDVGGVTIISCQEVMAVPYALGLRPGAIISDAVSTVQLNYYQEGLGFNWKYGIQSEVSGVEWFTYGLHGRSTYTGNFGIGVYGQSESTAGLISGGSWVGGAGLYGVAGASTGATRGVYGRSDSETDTSYGGHFAGYNGVYGEANNANGWAGYFEGGQGTYSENGFDTGGGDLAEHFPVREADLEPGDVVVIDPAGGALLTRSTTAYDTALAGVVATAPGLRMGSQLDSAGAWAEKDRRLIAVVGRVPVKVDASYGAIKPGDLLTTSPTPGHAMKAAEPQIGTILGKALGFLEAGTGVIEVLMTLR